MAFHRSVVLCTVLTVLSYNFATAQVGTSTIRGTVTDSTQASIAEARVTIRNDQTNIRWATETTSAGIFTVSALPPGPYTVQVEKPGFKRWSGSLVLQTGQTATLDVSLDLGTVETMVEVTSAAPVISLESTEIGDVKGEGLIRQLPLNGRAVSNLFNLTPGVEGGANPRINGSKVGSVEMLLDGISLVDRFGGGMARVQPGLDTIAEFRIETNGSRAEFSRPATVSLVSKGGTNRFSGSLFEVHRNNAAGLRARQRQDGNTAPQLIRNEFGASAGGPVLIPKLYNGRDRTFWFVAFEGFRQRQSIFSRAAMPLPEMWQGDLSQIVNAAGQRTTIYDPLTTAADGTRQPFPNGRIPTNRISPLAAKMREVTATPTININPFLGDNFDALYPLRLDENKWTTRLDHQLTAKDNLSVRYLYTDLVRRQLGARFGSPPPNLANPWGSQRQDAEVWSASVRHNRVFRPNLFNELTLGVQRNANSNGTLADFTPWADQLGFPNPFRARGWPTLVASPFSWLSDNLRDEKLTGYVLENNTTYVVGRHTIKFGGKYRYEQNNVRELQQQQGSHSFDGSWTALYDPRGDQRVPFTGNGFADMLLGFPTYLSAQNNRGYFYFRQHETGLFVQDTWKVTPRLTLDLGLRYDRWSPYSEARNRFVQVDPLTIASVFQVVTPGNIPLEQIPGIPRSQLASWAARGLTWTTAEKAGMPRNLVRADNNNFGPRAGFAYRMGNRTVLRGSYGEFFWTMPLSQILQTMRINPPLNLRYENIIGLFDGTATYAVRSRPQPQFSIGQAQIDTEGIVQIPLAAQSGLLMDGRNWKDARMRSWHLTWEREVMQETAVRLTYTGQYSTDLEQRYSFNSREGEYNWVRRTRQNPPANRELMRINKDWALAAVNRTGISSTHSLQAEIERRYSNGMAFQAFYTFTRSLTTSDAGGFSAGSSAINDTFGNNQIPERIQVLDAPDLSYDQLRRLVYYNSANVPAHRVRYNAVIALPFGPGKKWGSNLRGVSKQILGGWEIATIGEWRSGLWSGVAANRYLFGDPTLAENQRLLLTFAGRPQRLWFRGDFDPRQATNVDQNALQQLVPVDRGQRVLRPVGHLFDNRIPLPLADGSARLTTIEDLVNWNARNFYRGPGFWNLDTSVYKNFQFRESMRFQLCFDFFNVTNSPMDASPNTTTGLQDLSVQVNDPRIIQLRARFSW
ncbi:MAG: TonB-dependent receptor [Bryobacteraceae bacterium]|nr:TonB-dependent receptor [Bryobacteraceae bacterium]MDW8379690.1 TonB-dependent receptor [Bryobacterales bacterium]